MTPNHAELLSAFFDGEAVEAEALAASLREPDAIEFLMEFARLRRAVHDDASRPPEEFCEALRERLVAADARREFRHRVVRLSLAASLLLAAGIGGFSARALLERQQAAAGRQNITQSTAKPAGPAAQPASAPIPSPALWMRFDEWRDRVL